MNDAPPAARMTNAAIRAEYAATDFDNGDWRRADALIAEMVRRGSISKPDGTGSPVSNWCFVTLEGGSVRLPVHAQSKTAVTIGMTTADRTPKCLGFRSLGGGWRLGLGLGGATALRSDRRFC